MRVDAAGGLKIISNTRTMQRNIISLFEHFFLLQNIYIRGYVVICIRMWYIVVFTVNIDLYV